MEIKFKGIDVSKWQGSIDWAKVKNDGVQFAMLRTGYGKCKGQTDNTFERNYQLARENGLFIGAYHYSYAKSAEDAKKEAEYCLSIISGKTFEFPVAYDIEDKTQQDLPNKTINEIINAFCSTMEAAGYYVSVYANLRWLNNKIGDEVKSRYDVWLAQWADEPTYNNQFGIWQYSSSGSINGIKGRVDCNYAFKNYPEIMKSNGLNKFKGGNIMAEQNKNTFTPRQVLSLYNTPIFVSSTAQKETARKSGTFYIYDGIELNGRYRITSSPERAGATPIGSNVTGYVNKSDLKTGD